MTWGRGRGDRLKADLGRIRDAGNTIISAAFKDAGHLVSGYDAAISGSYLVGELHDFANDRDIHRKRLTGNLNTFADWAVKAADAYADGTGAYPPLVLARGQRAARSGGGS